MSQNGKALHASRKFLRRVLILGADSFPFRLLRKSLIVVVVICLLSGGYTTAVAKSDTSLGFEITGYLRHIEYGIDGKESKKEKHIFKLWLKDDFWLIRMTPSPESVKASLASSIELGTDGEKTYRLLTYNTDFDNTLPFRQMISDLDIYLAAPGSLSEQELVEVRAEREELVKSLKAVRAGAISKSLNKSLNKAIGSVFPFKYPNYYAEDHSSIIWFAYCSHGVWTDQEHVKFPIFFPSGIPPRRTEDNLTQATIVWTMASPHLPQIATFHHGGYRWEHSPTGHVMKPLPSPWDNGYTNATYNVLSFTNLAGRDFPLRFSITVSRIWRDLKGGVSLSPFDSYEGFTDSVKMPCDRSEFVPLIPTETLIENENKVQYLAQPGAWLRTTNVALLKDHQRQVLRAITAKKPRPTFVYLAFFLMISWPLFLLLRKHLGKKRAGN